MPILGGGYNALPPGDKVPISDALLLQNFRTDSLGRYISRQGYLSQFSIPGAGIAHSAASAGGPGAPLYVGANSGILNPLGAVYYNGNQTAISQGFDGNRIGFAFQNGCMYVMNRGKQGRHDPNAVAPVPNWQSWNLSRPPASPTVATGSTPSPATSATYTYQWQGTTIAASVAVGAQTVTPASMTSADGTAIAVGMSLDVSNSDYSHYETVVVTAVTGATFTAVFTSAKTGPGILVSFTTYVHSLNIAGNVYSFAQNGYSAAQVPLVMAGLASADPNCSVTYAGSGSLLVITPIVPNALFPISGSDGNTPENLATGSITSLPNGTYQYYLTFQSGDLSIESNPSPVSAAVNAASQAVTVTIPFFDAPTDYRIGFVNIYRTGGTLENAYRVGQVPSTVGSPATTFSDTVPDLAATNNGLVMPTQNDPPPAARGIIGPFFSQLFAWSTVDHPNRFFWTPINQPQYWPGSGDNQVGNWVDVGLDDEEIVWCSIHTNLIVIYKERSIWMMIGSSPSTATLECVYDGIGLAGQFALAPAGQVDYFVGPNGLYLFDTAQVHLLSGNILPLFNQNIVNAGPLTPPGSILPGSAFNSNSTAAYAIALGHAMGRLYISYAERGAGAYNLLVFDEGREPERNAYDAAERTGRWFYDRTASSPLGFFGFFFDGTSMIGLTGALAGAAAGLSIADFRTFATSDPAAPIESVYQSHYEDYGLPDNEKMWLEVRIDFEFGPGTTANVYAGFNNGLTPLAEIGGLVAGPRTTVAFNFLSLPGASDEGVLARNMSVAIDIETNGGTAILHNVYLYFYVEERLANVASTIPTDLGVGKVKECRELELDINPAGAVAVAIRSDLPGNALSVRQSPAIAAGSRAILKYPFVLTRGLLWQVSLTGGPFRLYSARLLMRLVGAFIEGYESAAGFTLDLQETNLGTDAIKRAREISIEIDTFGGSVTVSLLTDLPGNAQSVRYSKAVGNAGGRGYIRIPLPQGFNVAPIEGRYFRLQFSAATTNFALYGASIEFLAIGVYVEAYEAAGGAVYDSRHLDFGSTKVKEAREIELDIETGGALTASLYSDLPPTLIAGVGSTWSGTPGAQALIATGNANTTGRQTVRIPVTVNALLEQFAAGRQFRLILSSAAAWRLYGARLKLREYGEFLTSDEIAGGALWDSTPLDLGSQRVKAVKRIEVDLVTFSNEVNVTVLTSQGGSMLSRYRYPLATNGTRRTLTLPLPPGIGGRLLQLQINGTACALYAVRIWWRALNEPRAGWEWTALPVVATQPAWTWSAFPVLPTEAQWSWGEIASVEKTEDVWKWVDLDFSVTEGNR